MNIRDLTDFSHPRFSICLEKDSLPSAENLRAHAQRLSLGDFLASDYLSYAAEFKDIAPNNSAELADYLERLSSSSNDPQGNISSYLAALSAGDSAEVTKEYSYHDGIYFFSYCGRGQSSGYLGARKLSALGLIAGEAVIPRNFLDFLSPEDLESARFWITDLAASGETESVDNHLKAYRAKAALRAHPFYRSSLNLCHGLVEMEHLSRLHEFDLRMLLRSFGAEVWAYAAATLDEGFFHSLTEKLSDQEIAEINKELEIVRSRSHQTDYYQLAAEAQLRLRAEVTYEWALNG